jgi:hypothetical protein
MMFILARRDPAVPMCVLRRMSNNEDCLSSPPVGRQPGWDDFQTLTSEQTSIPAPFPSFGSSLSSHCQLQGVAG